MNTEWQRFLKSYQANIIDDAVADFSNNPQELQYMLQQDVMTDLSHFSAIVVSGPDAEKFLQGQLTCDMREIQANQSRLSAYCNVKGRVVATCRVFKLHDNYYLWLPRNMQPSMLTHLKKHALFSKVTLTLLDNEWISFGCAGKEVTKKIQQLGYKVPVKIDEIVAVAEGVIINIPGSTPRVIFFAKVNLAIMIWQQLALNLTLAGIDTWRLLDILAGIVTIYPETHELFTPHMLDYPKWQAVSFNKGCYLGQEIVARAEYLGKTKRKLYRVQTLAEQYRPALGDKLYVDGQEVGIVVEVARQSQESYQLLAVVREEVVLQDKITLLNNQKAQLRLIE